MFGYVMGWGFCSGNAVVGKRFLLFKPKGAFLTAVAKIVILIEHKHIVIVNDSGVVVIQVH